jgi:hypothetical protein
VIPVTENRIPALNLLVFLTQRICQFIEPFHLNLANVSFKVAKGVISSNKQQANHNYKTVQKESQEDFVSEFELHWMSSVLNAR